VLRFAPPDKFGLCSASLCLTKFGLRGFFVVGRSNIVLRYAPPDKFGLWFDTHMYLAAIEEFFFKYRRQGTILSPQNWLIAERWEQMGIPINIVCKGIRETCRGFRFTHQEGVERIDLLTYCEPEILRLWKEYRRSLLGAPEDSGKGDHQDQEPMTAMLRKRLACIRQGLCDEARGEGPWGDLKAQALEVVGWTGELDRIEREIEATGEINIDTLEGMLSMLDQEYMQALLSLLPAEEKGSWLREVEAALAPYKNQMDQDSYSQTIKLGIESMVRNKTNARRISLYAT